MSTYTHTTFAQAKDRLAALLGDPSKTFYTDFELGRYLIEALRFWGVTAQYWRKTVQFELSPGVTFYDVTGAVGDNPDIYPRPDPPQAFVVTDQELINDINLSLMEPIITNWSAGWIGSEQFDLDTIADVLAKSKDDILRQTSTVVTEQSFRVDPGVSRVVMAETEQDVSVSTIVRASFTEDETNLTLPLFAIDYYQAQATVDTATFPSVGRPKAFTSNNAPLLCIDLWPKPANGGTLKVYSQRMGYPRPFTPQLTPTVIWIPTDAAWILKYRAIDDLVCSDGIGKAPEISEYARQRWQQGVEILSGYGSVLWAELNGRRLTISSQFQLDAQRPMWENETGQPRSIQQLSWNLISVYPTPDQPYLLAMDTIVAAPIPAEDTDYIDVGPQYVQAIYDYAQHIATMKLQGGDFQATISLYQDCVKAALEHQASIAGSAINYRHQQIQAKADRIARPVRRSELAAETKQIVGGL